MIQSPAKLEYAPNLLIAGIEVTRSNDHATFRGRLHASTILRNLLPTLVLLSIAIALDFLLTRSLTTPISYHWPSHIFPAIFAVLAIANFINQFLPSLAPFTISIAPDAITLQKRTLSLMGTSRWERPHILGIRIARLRLQKQLLPRHFILIQHVSLGDIPILVGKPHELRELTPIICDMMNLSEFQHPALQLKPVARRAKAMRWSDGIAIHIASPFHHLLLIATAVIAAAIGIALVLGLNYYSTSEFETTGAVISRYIVGIPVAIVAWLALYQSILPLLHETTIALNSTQFQVLEKGWWRPFTGIWNLPDVGQLRTPTNNRELSIEVARQELQLLKNETPAILAWTRSTLETALTHARNQSTNPTNPSSISPA